MAGLLTYPFLTSLWECSWPVTNGAPMFQMAESHWRYHVISFTGHNGGIVELSSAFDLAATELEVAFTITKNLAPGGIIWQKDRLAQALPNYMDSNYFVEVSQTDVDEIAQINEDLLNHDHAILNLRPHLLQLSQAKALPRMSELRLLAYFALLESLLTHQPEPKDPYDSITRQITQKLALLYNRWKGSIDYSPFVGTPPKKLWQMMYAYRSAIAHGTQPDFQTKLRQLKSPAHGLTLVRDAVKTVIRHALREPRLIADLRDC